MNGTRKEKVQMKLNLVKDVKNHEKGFYRYTFQRRKARGERTCCDKAKGRTSNSS